MTTNEDFSIAYCNEILTEANSFNIWLTWYLAVSTYISTAAAEIKLKQNMYAKYVQF
jgi:hypothetical protein